MSRSRPPLPCAWLAVIAMMALVPVPGSAASTGLLSREEVVFIPALESPGVQLETTLFKPPGSGPFPLLVMNHGKAAGAPSKQARARYPVLAQEFLRRGYAVVLPMRQGFARSGGTYVDGACDLELNGRLQARDVGSAVRHFQQQPWIDARHVMVIGQSHGGMVTLAYGEQAAPGVRLLVNFAGGLRPNGGRCQPDWQDRMLRAFEHFGTQAKVPSLWFYGRNDSYFSAQFARQLLNQFDVGRAVAPDLAQSARAPARLVNTAAFGQDAHGMIEYSGAVPLWWPELEREMRLRGLPLPDAPLDAVKGRSNASGRPHDRQSSPSRF